MIVKATLKDVNTIYKLINQTIKSDFLLPRTKENIAESLRDFLVYKEKTSIKGVVALQLYTPELAEIRTLAVAKSSQNKGIGTKLVSAAIAEAKKIGVKKVFVLTLSKDWFEKQDFEVVEKQTLPEKIFKDCIFCPKLNDCHEVALTYRI